MRQPEAGLDPERSGANGSYWDRMASRDVALKEHTKWGGMEF